MTSRFIVGYRGPSGSKDTMLVYAVDQKEARVTAVQSNPYIKLYPTCIDYIIEDVK